MSALAVASLAKRFDGVQALDQVSLSVADGEFFCIVGPTNAGKSTLLKVIAGVHAPDRGTIVLGGRDVTAMPPRARKVSLLFQNIALFPTMTGFQNIAFPLTASGIGGPEVEHRVREVAAMLKVGHILDRHPRTYSGGEQQRVAIGRAIVQPGDLLMLDEPLSNLDARIRIALRIEFKKLHRELRQTILYVTHDQVEALSLSDRVGVLHQGRFQQVGTPDEVYHRPANRFVAEFIGTPPMNFLDAELAEEAGELTLVGDGFRLPVPQARTLAAFSHLPRRIGFGVRPEAVRVAPRETAATPLRGEVLWLERLGGKTVLDVRLGRAMVKAVVPPDHPVRAEGTAWLGLTPQAHHLMDRDGGAFYR